MQNKLILILMAGLTAYIVFLTRQIDNLEMRVNTVPSEEMLISIVDIRLQEIQAAQKRLIQKERLMKLKSEFRLADNHVNKLIYGNPVARISMKMFGDIECPFCRKIHKELKKIVDNSSGVINWQYKHFPLSIHNPAAALNAQAVECVLETHDNQSAWIALSQFIDSTKGNGKGIQDIIQLSRSFGLNGRLIELCINTDSHKTKINQDYNEGRKLNIMSTPAIQIIDTQTNSSNLIKGYHSAEEILQIINSLLK